MKAGSKGLDVLEELELTFTVGKRTLPVRFGWHVRWSCSGADEGRRD